MVSMVNRTACSSYMLNKLCGLVLCCYPLPVECIVFIDSHPSNFVNPMRWHVSHVACWYMFVLARKEALSSSYIRFSFLDEHLA